MSNTIETDAIFIERDTDRKIRHRNKLYYRVNHWPIWIFVFFIAPGPLTFDLFAHGFDSRMAMWLGLVLLGTGIAGLRGRLPGCEPAPYIIRFTEDRPNPLYRRVCYTTAWGEVVAFAVLNTAGLAYAVATRTQPSHTRRRASKPRSNRSKVSGPGAMKKTKIQIGQ